MNHKNSGRSLASWPAWICWNNWTAISLDAAYGAAQRCKSHAIHRCDEPFYNCDKSFLRKHELSWFNLY